MIKDRLLQNLIDYFEIRKKNVQGGVESAEFSALLFQIYGYGMASAIDIVFVGLDDLKPKVNIIKVVDSLASKIDPEWKQHANERLNAKPASISKKY